MDRDLRIIFMGTPDFAVPSLDFIHQNFNVVGVITAPDRKAGRGQKVSQSAVKKFALENELKVLQPTNLKSPEFHEELKALNANLQVVVAFRMLPNIVWQMPEYGTVNLHGSLLPQYRGAAPINWAVINGETETGVTSFFIEEKIDTGNIIMHKEIRIGMNESAGELHDRMMVIGAEVLLETIKLIEKDEAIPKPQSELASEMVLKPAPKIFKENCQIDWNNSVAHVHNFIRGLSPYPTAWTEIKEKTFKIFRALPTEMKSDKSGEISIVDNKRLFISCNDRKIEILDIQMQGKKRMKVEDFLRGNSDELK